MTQPNTALQAKTWSPFFLHFEKKKAGLGFCRVEAVALVI